MNAMALMNGYPSGPNSNPRATPVDMIVSRSTPPSSVNATPVSSPSPKKINTATPPNAVINHHSPPTEASSDHSRDSSTDISPPARVPSPLAFYGILGEQNTPPPPKESLKEKPVGATWEELVKCLEYTNRKGRNVVDRVMSDEGMKRKGVWGLTAVCCSILLVLLAMEGWPSGFQPVSSSSTPSSFPSLITTTTTTVVEEIKNTKMFVDEEGVEERVKSVKTVWESRRMEGVVEGQGQEDEEEEVVKVEVEVEVEGGQGEEVTDTSVATPSPMHHPPTSLFVVSPNRIQRYSTLFKPLSSIQTSISQPKLGLPEGLEFRDVIVEKVLEEGVVVDKEMRKGFRKIMRDMIKQNEGRLEAFLGEN